MHFAEHLAKNWLFLLHPWTTSPRAASTLPARLPGISYRSSPALGKMGQWSRAGSTRCSKHCSPLAHTWPHEVSHLSFTSSWGTLSKYTEKPKASVGCTDRLQCLTFQKLITNMSGTMTPVQMITCADLLHCFQTAKQEFNLWVCTWTPCVLNYGITDLTETTQRHRNIAYKDKTYKMQQRGKR